MCQVRLEQCCATRLVNLPLVAVEKSSRDISGCSHSEIWQRHEWR